jgi:DNA-binding transcriptional regulator YiaG
LPGNREKMDQMKAKTISKEPVLDPQEMARLVKLKAESFAGRSRPVRVRTIRKSEDGVITIGEIDPGVFHEQRAQAFEAKNRVAKFRHRLDRSQAEFAELLGIPLRTLQGWERNATPPSGAAKTLLDIVEYQPEVLEALRKEREKCG